MGSKRDEYIKKFRDVRWQEKRLAVMNRDQFTCQACCEKEGKTLNVHHKYYLWGKDPWDYPDYALVTLCEECHEKEQSCLHDAPLMFQQFLSQHDFLNSHMVEIARGFGKMPDIGYLPEVRAEFLSWFLGNEEEFRRAFDNFLEHCRMENRKG